MSFFGFDKSLPGSSKSEGEFSVPEAEKPLDFEETYRGFGEYEEEEEDYLNEETFGANAELGTDFDFGHKSPSKGMSDRPDAMFPGSYVTSNKSYVAAAKQGDSQPLEASVDLKPMESLWNGGTAPQLDQQEQKSQPQEEVAESLSMEELERHQLQRQQQLAAQQRFFVPPPGYLGPQGFLQHPSAPPQRDICARSVAPGGLPPQFPMIYQQGQPPSQKIPQQAGAAQAAQLQAQVQAQIQAQIHPHATPNEPIHNQSAVSGSASSPRTRFSTQFGHQHQHLRRPRGIMRRDPLTAEEQKRLQTRQAKVERILKHSGLMTPRDKDFITRYQLSQIVTEDPYNEDFYFQVFKIIQYGGIVGESNKDLIARAYLEHSGHRLGGRYKRADVALQRMQNQVEKAVTVAKERPQKNKDHIDASREGVLGKISSVTNSKAPRRQLQIPAPKLDNLENTIVEDFSSTGSLNISKSSTPTTLDVVTDSLENVEINQKSRARRSSSYAFTSVDQNSLLSRSGGRRFVLSSIETIYGVILELEEQLRNGKQIYSSALWGALHIDDESYDVCPFISMLSFNKGIKIIPRIFNFLDKSQKLKLLQTFFAELSHLNIIIISSYKTNDSPTESQLKKIDLFQSIFLKIIVSFLSNSADFTEIMGLLLCLIKNNNLSFISTSKIGLNLITVLISRAALIKQDIKRSNVLSSPEISDWNGVYDKLFTSLETKLVLVFPPKEYLDKVIMGGCSRPATAPASSSINSTIQSYDQAYIWQFLASLALSGKLNHQRIIIDEIRDEIFGTIDAAEQLGVTDHGQDVSLYKREKLYQDLNLFLNVMGLVARDKEITELK